MTLATKTLAAAAALLIAAPAGASADHHKEMAPTQNIVEIAAGNENFETLVAAVQAAGLVDALSGVGPLTVFAPTDAAFGELPAGTVDQLVMPANKGTLTNILTYHVVAGDYSASDIVAALEANGGSASFPTLLDNASITAALYGGEVYLSDYKGNAIGVIATDIDATNGTIHVIDGVLMP
ncbi:fasciclin domain-containing protein [Sphingomicrobium astaxanthinifaciens]|uniref:fasciclin domain-containing protein n=1 Tax=Sphingomicrobium astaxanthinifaciens TaxID=1227949 RepID=UPI001FCB0DE9|nr:fasciclin domain-containing protein [Sphingomicrobium astaxanthinifaciens]MCJ7421770.1 fasciclin domain-containing protein [Sphingomicrobium astaxanthinifaciens]